MALAGGALLALIAFAIGLVVMRPSMTRAAALMAGMNSVSAGEERQSRVAEIGRLRARGASARRSVAWLVLAAPAAMAAARYR